MWIIISSHPVLFWLHRHRCELLFFFQKKFLEWLSFGPFFSPSQHAHENAMNAHSSNNSDSKPKSGCDSGLKDSPFHAGESEWSSEHSSPGASRVYNGAVWKPPFLNGDSLSILWAKDVLVRMCVCFLAPQLLSVGYCIADFPDMVCFLQKY